MPEGTSKRSDEELFAELFDEGLNEGSFLFGRYLRAKGIVSEDDIFKARMLQKTRNQRIGEIAVEMGYMTAEVVSRLLVAQEETGLRFGHLAVKLGFLSRDELDDIVRERESSHVYIGEALVSLGVVKHDVMVECLSVFQRLRVRLQQMDA